MTTPENPVQPDEVISDTEGADADAAEQSAASGAEQAPEAEAPDEVAELTADLQRVSAEFANYRKRTAREVIDARAAGRAAVVAELLVVVDDLDRARSHGDLESGPLKALSDKLDGVLKGLGLEPFGAQGDDFDPSIHEAVQHDGDGADPVLGTVLRQGYQIDGKVIRNAMVAVVDRTDSEQSEPAAAKQDDQS